MLEILLGQIPEAIYFALFMILTKNLKEKRIKFTVLMIIEYLLLKYLIEFNMWFQVSYTIITYIILKLLYKEKAQITDVFTFCIASIILIISSILLFFIFGQNMLLVSIANRILIFLFLFIFRHKLNNIQKVYKKLWNRNDNCKKKIKSTTFRALNLVIFNITFYLLSLCIKYAIYFNSR